MDRSLPLPNRALEQSLTDIAHDADVYEKRTTWRTSSNNASATNLFMRMAVPQKGITAIPASISCPVELGDVKTYAFALIKYTIPLDNLVDGEWSPEFQKGAIGSERDSEDDLISAGDDPDPEGDYIYPPFVEAIFTLTLGNRQIVTTVRQVSLGTVESISAALSLENILTADGSVTLSVQSRLIEPIAFPFAGNPVFDQSAVQLDIVSFGR